MDVTTAGGYGRLYGPGVALPSGVGGEEFIYGDEFLTFSDEGRTRNVTMMVQVPFSFDPANACIVTATSSGSRGVYGAIGTAGEWGLKRGCAVAYSDKGTGTGAHDLDRDTVNLIRGERADADQAGRDSTFTAPISDRQQDRFISETPDRFAFKHAHSEANPEAAWDAHVLDSIDFAFHVLNEVILPERHPDAPGLRPDNTLVIASSVSNGGGAAVRAAELDRAGLIDGVAVSEPNVNPVFDDRFTIVQGGGAPLERHSRTLYDYTTLINVYQGCANLALPTAPLNLVPDALETARCQSLVDMGLLESDTPAEQAANAQAVINGYGILEEQNIVQPAQWLINVPQSIAVTYANAYARASVLDRLCDYGFAATDPTTFEPVPLPEAVAAVLFSTSSGIPPTPTGGVDLVDEASVGGPLSNRQSISPGGAENENLDGALCLRALELGEDPATGAPLKGQDLAFARQLASGVQQILADGDLHGTPAIIVTGRADAILPPNHTSRAYYGLNQLVEGADSGLRYVEVTNAQHLDALIPAGFSAIFIPLHHYLLQALDLLYAHLTEGTPLPESQVVHTVPRSGDPLPELMLSNLPPIELDAAMADEIRFTGTELQIPE